MHTTHACAIAWLARGVAVSSSLAVVRASDPTARCAQRLGCCMGLGPNCTLCSASWLLCGPQALLHAALSALAVVWASGPTAHCAQRLGCCMGLRARSIFSLPLHRGLVRSASAVLHLVPNRVIQSLNSITSFRRVCPPVSSVGLSRR